MCERRWYVGLLLVVAAACSRSTPEPLAPAPTVASSVQQAVRAAYLDAWAVRDEAVHKGDPSILGRRFSGGDPSTVVGNLETGLASAFDIVSASVTARVSAGLDVAGNVVHDIQSVNASDDASAAQVVDRITDRTYLVDRATGVDKSSREETVYTETWFLVRDEGEWKAIYFARSP